MLKEFKEFAMRGSVMDLAIGVIIGAAFGKIVTSLVDNLLTPLIGLVMGGTDFSGLHFEVGKSKFMYGAFIQAVIDFVIVAFVIFLIVKAINRMKRPAQEAETASEMKDCPYCLSSVPLLATKCAHCTSALG